MARAALRILYHRFRAKRLDNRGNLLRLMPNNHDNLSRLQRLASPHKCSTSERPPARCSTLAISDFRRVPFPAASTRATVSFAGIEDYSRLTASV